MNVGSFLVEVVMIKGENKSESKTKKKEIGTQKLEEAETKKQRSYEDEHTNRNER